MSYLSKQVIIVTQHICSQMQQWLEGIHALHKRPVASLPPAEVDHGQALSHKRQWTTCCALGTWPLEQPKPPVLRVSHRFRAQVRCCRSEISRATKETAEKAYMRRYSHCNISFIAFLKTFHPPSSSSFVFLCSYSSHCKVLLIF